MTDAPWEKPSEIIPEGAKADELDEFDKFVKEAEDDVEFIASPPTEQPEPKKQVLDTGIMFFGERLLLETDSEETLDAFKKAYHKLERHYLGDYRKS